MVAGEDLPLAPIAGGGALLGTVTQAGQVRAAWDLGRLLGVGFKFGRRLDTVYLQYALPD